MSSRNEAGMVRALRLQTPLTRILEGLAIGGMWR